MLFRKKKLKKLYADESSQGITAYRKIDHLCCISYTLNNSKLKFGANTCKDMDDMVDCLNVIEVEIKKTNAIRQVMMDWENGILSDRQAIIFITEILKDRDVIYYK